MRMYMAKKFIRRDFKGVFIAGSSFPLNWDFENLTRNEKNAVERS